jgi:plastocyanin
MRECATRFFAGLLAWLIGLTGIAAADTIVVQVQTNFFSPLEVSIATGDTIHWVWISGSHDTISVDGLWASDILAAPSTFDYTFTSPGDYAYICSLHIDCCHMQGIVHVTDPVNLAGSLAATDPDDPDAAGTATFNMVPYRSTFDLLVQNVVSTTAVDVFVNGNFVGTIGLDASGNGELFLDTDNGDTVPALQNGDEIEVYDAADDATLILIGNVSPA